jgi:hypothetical protein
LLALYVIVIDGAGFGLPPVPVFDVRLPNPSYVYASLHSEFDAPTSRFNASYV